MCPCEDMNMQAPEVGDGNWASALATGPSLHPAPPSVLVSHSTPVVVLQFFLLLLSLPALSNSLASESPCSWGCPQIPDSLASTSRVPSYRCVPISLAPLVFNLGILFWYILKSTPIDSFLDLLRLSSSCFYSCLLLCCTIFRFIFYHANDGYLKFPVWQLLCLCLVWNATICGHSQLWSCLFVCLVSHWTLGVMLWV